MLIRISTTLLDEYKKFVQRTANARRSTVHTMILLEGIFPTAEYGLRGMVRLFICRLKDEYTDQHRLGIWCVNFSPIVAFLWNLYNAIHS